METPARLEREFLQDMWSHVGPERGEIREDLLISYRALNGKVGWAVNYFWRTLAADLPRLREILIPTPHYVACPSTSDKEFALNSSQGRVSIGALPTGVVLRIFTYFHPVELLITFVHVNKKWNELIASETLWQRMHESYPWKVISPSEAVQRQLETKRISTGPRRRRHAPFPVHGDRKANKRIFTKNDSLQLDIGRIDQSMLSSNVRRGRTEGPWRRGFRTRYMWEARHACPERICPGNDIPLSVCPVIYGFPANNIMPAVNSGYVLLGMDHVPMGEWKLPGWMCKSCKCAWIKYPWSDLSSGPNRFNKS